jgi:carboxyl-terminal processing protease
MRAFERLARMSVLFVSFGVAAYLAFRLNGGGLWEGLAPAIAANSTALAGQPAAPYDLTALKVVNEVVKKVRDRYVDPKRVRPREMLLSALNYVQREVAQVIVLHEEGAPTVKVRVDTQEKEFRVDNVQGPWDVTARLHDIFAFLQDNLRNTDVDLRDVEYAACNGMLHTLDPHSVLLTPDAYKEMNISTGGQFGGLGIVISIRDQQLTVMNPMPGTPAGKAGLKRYDRILKINGESTLNMGLNEAVQHLRGAPQSKVTIWIHRDGNEGWTGSKPFELERETIHVASVEHRMLEGADHVGYIRLKQFQANTSDDLNDALADMKKGGELKGLVLDLRGNPGGLLDQAAKVADKFIAEGPIVTTVNPSEGRDEKVAHEEGTEPNYPIALLVNGSSASASEIVAGAMKNHDRAVLVGETTFGKGSVQLIFNDLPDKSALKLTIAQYLTEPGDISIQGTGVTPDIELDPMTVDEKEMDLTVDTTNLVKERDLARSLSNARIREGQHPLETVRYDLPQKERQDLRERGGDPDDNFQMDFWIKFGRDLVSHVPQGKRLDQMRAAKTIVAETRASELSKVSSELRAMQVDWADAPADVPQAPPPGPGVPPSANVDVKIETVLPGANGTAPVPSTEVTAGDAMQLRITVTNKGPSTLYRLNALTTSDDPMFDNKELIFGKLEPGKSRTAMAPLGWCELEGYKAGSTAPLPKDAPRICRIARDSLTRADGIKIHFDEARGRAPADTDTRVTVKALERPVFAYSYQIADNRKGNGDGRLQRDESLTMYLTVKNTGRGRSFDSQANVRNLSGDGLLLHEGRFDISNMMPGDVKKVQFTFDVGDLTDPEAKVELSISDRDLRESVAEKVRMPFSAPLAIVPASGARQAKSTGAALFEAPLPAARVFGQLPAGVSANVLGTSGDFVKLALGDGRFGFARAADLDPANGASGGAVAFVDSMAHAPPVVEVSDPALATRDTHAAIHGTTGDGERLLDAYVFVNSRKVFYQSNRNGTDPKSMPFAVDLPLRPGVNMVSVIARETPDTVGHRTFIIRRDGPDGALLTTPKTDDDLSESGSDDGE